MADLWQEAIEVARRLARTPSLAVPLVLATALGVGVTTAAWTAADAVLWKPLPYPAPARLVMLWGRAPPRGPPPGGGGPPPRGGQPGARDGPGSRRTVQFSDSRSVCRDGGGGRLTVGRAVEDGYLVARILVLP
jgi:hypothetical protein